VLFRWILAACLVAGIASAQGKRGGAGGNKGDDDMGMMTRMPRMSRFDTIADKLRLSKEQKEQAGAFFDAAQEAAAPLN
jgi:hypothetical protein